MNRNIYFNLNILLLTTSFVCAVTLQNVSDGMNFSPLVNETNIIANSTENPFKQLDDVVILNSTTLNVLHQEQQKEFLELSTNSPLKWMQNNKTIPTVDKPQDEGNNSALNQNQNVNVVHNDNERNGDAVSAVDNPVENAKIQISEITEMTEHSLPPPPPPRYRRFNGQRQKLQRYRLPQQVYASRNNDCHIRRNNNDGDTNKRFNDEYDEYDWFTVRRQNVYRKGQKKKAMNRPSKNSKRKQQRPMAQTKQPQYYNHSFLHRIRKQQNRKPYPSSSSNLDYPIVSITEPQQQQLTSMQKYSAEIIPISWFQKLSEQEKTDNFENNHQLPSSSSSSSSQTEYVLMIPENLLTPQRKKKKQIPKKKLPQSEISVKNTTENILQNMRLHLQQHIESPPAVVVVAENGQKTPNKEKDIPLKKPFSTAVKDENPSENIVKPIDAVVEGDQKNTQTRYIIIGDEENDDDDDDVNDNDDDVEGDGPLEREIASAGRRYFDSGSIKSTASPAIGAIYKGRLFRQNPFSLEYLRGRIL